MNDINLLVKHDIDNHSISEWNGTTERRHPESCRRSSDRDRRGYSERRYDSRKAKHPNRTLYGWVRSITRARLGVDRRQQGDQRIIENRRTPLRPNSMLTKEEIADLLS
jgi:hypothetical protein